MELRSSRSRSRTPFKTTLSQESFDKETFEEGNVEKTVTRTTRSSTLIKSTEANSTDSKSVKVKSGKKKTAVAERILRKVYKTSDYSSEDGENEVSSTRTTISQNEKNQLIEDAKAAANGSSQVSALDLYIKSGRYWDVYPKTDWTYSPHSRDRVEIAPGVVAMPNMSRRTIHSLEAVSSSYTTNVVHKTTNTDATVVGYSNKYYDTIDSNIRPRKLFSEDEEETTVTRTTQTFVRRWSRIKRTFFQFLRTVASVFLYLTFVQTYFFSKLHHLSSRLMLVDTWLLKKRTKGTDKLAMVMLLCLLPLLLLGGWWLLTTMGNFMYMYLNTTSIADPITVPESIPVVVPVVSNVKNEPEEKIVKITERIMMEPPTAGEIAAQLSAEQLEQIGANVLLKNEPIYKEELNKIREDLYKFQAFNAHNVARLRHEMGRCCQKPVINIEHQILELLNDPSFLSKQKGFNDYLRGLFVAKNDLEDMLANLTVNLQGSFNDLIYSNSKVLMNEVAMKLKQQTLSGKYELPSDEHIHRVVRDVLAVYDADRTGLVDYALESMGGQVLTTRCTESYHSGKAVVSVLGIPLWYPVNSPRTVITPDLSPGQCWAFQNFPGFLVIKLSHFVKIDAFSMEHVSKLLVPNGKIDSAPKEFEVYGLLDENDKNPVLLGRYTYDYDGDALQYFAVQNAEQIYGVVELRILSNHGNPNYTCLYRFRVHGQTS